MRRSVNSLIDCLFVAFVAALMLVSCTSLRPVRSDEVHASLKAGDTVSIVTKDGKKTDFRVVAVTAEAIVGEDERIALGDVRELQKREVSASRTAGLVGAILGGAVLVGLLVWLIASLASGAGAVVFGGG